MPRKAKATQDRYVFIPHEAIVEAFGEKNPLRPHEDLDLKDEYMFPLGDPILVALRESFSLTYPNRTEHIESKRMLEKIRSLAAEALKPLEEVLEQLKLPSVGKYEEDEDHATVFKLVIAPIEKLTPRIDPAACVPADPVIRALREVLSLSFSEAYTERDYRRVFAKVRKLAAATLIPYNEVLEDLEIEPVAMPSVWEPEQA